MPNLSRFYYCQVQLFRNYETDLSNSEICLKIIKLKKKKNYGDLYLLYELKALKITFQGLPDNW